LTVPGSVAPSSNLQWGKYSLHEGARPVLFVISAILKPGSEPELIKYHAEFNEHLGPSGEQVRLAGVLRNPEGMRRGYLAFYESDDIEDAQNWLEASPFYQAHLYERVDVHEYQVEVGQID
jgi:uncharacterized protein YciI